MSVKSTIAAATTAAALLATPAFAADAPTGETPAKGKATAPGQLCKNESKKKTMKGKGKSPFAACVVGVKRAQRETETKTAPAKLCKDQSKKKGSTDKKSPFAACVSGAAKAQNEQR